MMKGNKWKTFLLDVSFVGWSILSVFTLSPNIAANTSSILFSEGYNVMRNTLPRTTLIPFSSGEKLPKSNISLQ